MSLIYGVDSKFPANTRLTNGYLLYDWIMRKSCYPSFWGRSITGESVIAKEEMEYLKSKNCKIACILRDFSETVISSNNGTDDALKAIEAAKNLGIPQNKGIALFADIPSDWSINHNWMIGFASNVLNNGYIPGFMGNTDSSKNFNFGRQCSHYVQATRDIDQFKAIYWAKEPKYDFDPEIWAPYAPSELLPHDMHLWQYGEIEFHAITADKSYVRDETVTACFWDLGKGQT